MYTFRIPAGGNAIFQALRELVGEPSTTERLACGLSAVRLDRFPCGCLRTYTARLVWGVAEAEEALDPCAQHRHLTALCGVFRAEPEAPQTLARKAKGKAGKREN
jgi:hypothetical protein